MKRRYSAYKIVCPHCLHLVFQKTYEEHRRLYYNPEKNEWMKELSLEQHEDPTTDSSLTDQELLSDISIVAGDPPDYGSFNVYSEPDSPALSDKSLSIDLLQHNSAELEPTAVSPVHVSSDDSNHDYSGSSEEWDETDAEDSVEPSTNIRQPHAPRK